MEKTYKYLNSEYTLKKSRYTNNGTLAVVLCNDEEEFVITVNLEWGFIINPQQQYVDTNNCPDIEKFLTENGIAKKIPNCECQSGWCTYPLYEFDTSLMEEME